MKFILSGLIICSASAAFAEGYVYHCQLSSLDKPEAAFSIDARGNAEGDEYRIQYLSDQASTLTEARRYRERLSFTIPAENSNIGSLTEHTFVLDTTSLEVIRITKSVASNKVDQIQASIARGSCSESEDISYIASRLLCDTNALDGNLNELFYLNEKLGKIEINYLNGASYTPEQLVLGDTISLSHELPSDSITETIKRTYSLDLADFTISAFDTVTPTVDQMLSEGGGFGLGVCTSTFK